MDLINQTKMKKKQRYMNGKIHFNHQQLKSKLNNNGFNVLEDGRNNLRTSWVDFISFMVLKSEFGLSKNQAVNWLAVSSRNFKFCIYFNNWLSKISVNVRFQQFWTILRMMDNFKDKKKNFNSKFKVWISNHLVNIICII